MKLVKCDKCGKTTSYDNVINGEHYILQIRNNLGHIEETYDLCYKCKQAIERTLKE